MPDIKVLLFDVGGVLLSNAWDTDARRLASERFDLDWDDFQYRHESVARDFETGKLTMTEYLNRTVLYCDRTFSEAEFVDFMKAQSVSNLESMRLLAEVAASGEYLLATLNNESRELNDFRIETFGLRRYFTLFMSSCYLGMRKPEHHIYKAAVDIVQHHPNECVFIDDRELNLECANLAGIRSIHFQGADQTRTALNEMGVSV
jgi:putative hydrolase of the HAD superfamily